MQPVFLCLLRGFPLLSCPVLFHTIVFFCEFKPDTLKCLTWYRNTTYRWMPHCPHCSQRGVCIRSREAANHSRSSAFFLLWLTAEEYYSRFDFIKPRCWGCWKGKTRLPMSVSLGVVVCCVGKDSEGIRMVLIMRNLRKCVCQSCFQLVPVKVQLCAIVTTVSTRSFTPSLHLSVWKSVRQPSACLWELYMFRSEWTLPLSAQRKCDASDGLKKDITC